jgi:hypothetical protein
MYLHSLSLDSLIKAYLEAIELELEEEFIDLLLNELIRREILIDGLTEPTKRINIDKDSVKRN